MYCVATFCVVCLKKEEQYRTILRTNSDDAQLLNKLRTCSFVTDFLHTNASLFICNKCYETLQIAYEFNDMCHKNSAILRGYITQLSHVRAYTPHEIEFIALSDIKLESVDEVIEQIAENLEPEPNVVSSDLMLNVGKLKKEVENINNKEGSTDKEGAIIQKEVEHCITKEEMHSLVKDVNIKDEQLTSSVDLGTIDDQEVVESINNENKLLMHDEFFNIQCNICNKTFTSTVELKSHKSIHNGEQRSKCTVCAKSFAQVRYLKVHMLSHTGEKKYECTVCKKRYVQSQNLQSHMLTHTGERKYQCTICEKRCTHSQHLKTHMVTHTGEKQYHCIICKKSFARSQSLKLHIATHTGDKKYQCTICEKRFTFPQHLKSHVLTHTGEKKYKCTICEKKFKQSQHLKSHMVIHTGERKYQCTICEKRFIQSQHLKTHELTHTGEKRYECSMCEKKFTRSENLKLHILTHTEEKK